MLILVQLQGDQPLPTQIPIQDAGAAYPLTAVNQVTAQLVANGQNVWSAPRVCTIVDVPNGIVELAWTASDFVTAGSWQLYLTVYWNNSANWETLPPILLRVQGFPFLNTVPQAAPGATPPDVFVRSLIASPTTTTFNPDGSITETYPGGLVVTTTFGASTITEAYSAPVSTTRTTTFGASGITEALV